MRGGRGSVGELRSSGGLLLHEKGKEERESVLKGLWGTAVHAQLHGGITTRAVITWIGCRFVELVPSIVCAQDAV